MPEIKIKTEMVMSSWTDFEHLIWRIVNTTKPEKAGGSGWYADNGISDKIKELWELIK